MKLEHFLKYQPRLSDAVSHPNSITKGELKQKRVMAFLFLRIHLFSVHCRKGAFNFEM